MKTIVLTTVLMLTLCFVSTGNTIVAKGQSNSSFGDYTIEQLNDHMIYNNKELDQYLITYEKSDIKVVVAVDKQKKCKKYYVLTDKLPIQYECDGTYFGVKKLDKDVASNGYHLTANAMNKQEFFNQRVLISGITDTLAHLNLIASFYPGLLA